jgi:hypothetical protein
MDACDAYWRKKMEWHCSIYELDAPLPPCVKGIAIKAISAICDDVDRKLPFIERKAEINIEAESSSFKTPEAKAACRDLKKEASKLEFLTQLGSEDCPTSQFSSEEEINSPGTPDSDKTLAMEDVSDGEFSPTQATQELLSDLLETKADEPKKVAVITPKLSTTDKKAPPIELDGETVFKPLKKRRRIESSQSTLTQFSQYIRYGQDDSEVEDL